MLDKFPELDVAIIGAGPSGLAAAAKLADSGLRYGLFDCGLPLSERSRSRGFDLTRGVGGAGLFSDGKFSYFPSASSLWDLDAATLREAYDWFRELLSIINTEPPYFPDTAGRVPTSHKQYRSDYTTLDQRVHLINQLRCNLGENEYLGASVVNITRTRDNFRIHLQNGAERGVLMSRSIILATGRFGPLHLPSIVPDLPCNFRRIEVGLRIEQPSDTFDLRSYTNTDIKLISPDESYGGEWRTFCTCRDGEVVYSGGGGEVAASGRADVRATGLTNIGLNYRIRVDAVGTPLYHEMNEILRGGCEPRKVALESYLSETADLLGPTLDGLFRKKLLELNCSAADTWLYSPCIEGVGYYPELDHELKSPFGRLWVCGDATGLFRGLTSALVSGHYVASKAIEQFSTATDVPAFVKQSKVESMPTAFTAQSKAYFYCRDAVCEYAFQKGYLPLNPFRVFDYFLGDRVDRDAIRNGNNQLISLSDELWVFGPISDGVLFEIVRARSLNIPVRFFTIGTRSREIKPLDESDLTFEPEIHSRQITREQLLSLVKGHLDVRSQPRQEVFGF